MQHDDDATCCSKATKTDQFTYGRLQKNLMYSKSRLDSHSHSGMAVPMDIDLTDFGHNLKNIQPIIKGKIT